jgi:hypothetical protein
VYLGRVSGARTREPMEVDESFGLVDRSSDQPEHHR